MFLRPITRSSWRAPISISSSSYTSKTKRQYQSSQHLDNASPTSSIQTIPSCPSPTCACEPTPEMPRLLGIDYSKPLNGSMAAYAEQVLICTGKDDWPSKIEDDNSGDNLAADIKELVGRGGPYSDPYHNISTLNSSFRSTTPPHRTTEVQVLTTSAYLLPSFKYIPFLPRVSFDSVTALVRGYLLPRTLNPAHDNLSPIHRDRLIRSPDHQAYLYGVQDVKDIMILICGHGGRDARCGIYGPLLQSEFEKALPRSNISVLKGEVRIPELVDQGKLLEDSKSANEEVGNMKTARVGLISHIGGHKFAGNIIVYIPPGSKLSSTGENHPLAGCGIWYGRVEPKHVEGIIKETVVEGKVIADHFRGGIKQGGEILKI